jgi:ferredoxin
VRLVVDLTVCQGYAQCCFLAPDVFELSGEEALLPLIGWQRAAHARAAVNRARAR